MRNIYRQSWIQKLSNSELLYGVVQHHHRYHHSLRCSLILLLKLRSIEAPRAHENTSSDSRNTVPELLHLSKQYPGGKRLDRCIKLLRKYDRYSSSLRFVCFLTITITDKVKPASVSSLVFSPKQLQDCHCQSIHTNTC